MGGCGTRKCDVEESSCCYENDLVLIVEMGIRKNFELTTSYYYIECGEKIFSK